jgi:sialidase-1
MVVFASSAGTVADAQGISESEVFVSGKGGYHTYRIPSLIVTSKGTLLAFCEGRKNGKGDSGDIDLLVKRSSDSGFTWSTQETIWDDGPNTCGNPCPVIDRRNGRIVLLTTWNRGDDHGKEMKRGASKDTRRPFVLFSDDDGHSWSSPREITGSVKGKDWWWYATGPGIGIQIRRGPHAGRLVIPANHTSSHHGFGSLTIFSDDGGETWGRSNVIKPACGESQLVELADGTLMINSRSQSFTDEERTGYRSIAFSQDAGETWSEPEFDKHLGDPVCQASLIRYSLETTGGRNRLVFSNPNPPISPQRGTRIKMTVRLSYDEGKTWPVSKLLHSGPSAYSALAALPDGDIGCLYERGDTRLYETITLAKFSLDWLTDGKFPSH